MSAEKQKNNWITIGKISSPWGIHGWTKIESFTTKPTDILNYNPWSLSTNDKIEQKKLVEVEDNRIHAKKILVKLAGFDTPEDVKELAGLSIQIPRIDLPELTENEYYWSDLIGLQVINQQGEHIGEVDCIIETGSNDVLLVNMTNGKQTAIPWLPENVIKKVSLADKKIFIDWEIL